MTLFICSSFLLSKPIQQKKREKKYNPEKILLTVRLYYTKIIRVHSVVASFLPFPNRVHEHLSYDITPLTRYLPLSILFQHINHDPKYFTTQQRYPRHIHTSVLALKKMKHFKPAAPWLIQHIRSRVLLWQSPTQQSHYHHKRSFRELGFLTDFQ